MVATPLVVMMMGVTQDNTGGNGGASEVGASGVGVMGQRRVNAACWGKHAPSVSGRIGVSVRVRYVWAGEAGYMGGRVPGLGGEM